ncbi:auxin-repressed 12.5 kDa protein-like [Impatiens glandulifera]|uniref:auxin-repressed 12.5 kDa protein-like n=1 Tax=Impatiens glandulifera TaxID=253017 RepID=UPI001FB10FC7|nr:auxin-repressed 12.5 kDa protein-like [Impatiens glandulifera]
MGLIEKLWDDGFAGPPPDSGLGKLRLRNIKTVKPMDMKEIGESSSNSPTTPGTPSGEMSPKDNVWRSVFNPGRNSATKRFGSQFYDKPQPNSPTVYDWLYSGETRSKHR